jgi:hypothetical protein
MRTFSCFTTHPGSTVPMLSFIMADTEARARILIRRELLDEKEASSVDVCEGGKLLWTERS